MSMGIAFAAKRIWISIQIKNEKKYITNCSKIRLEKMKIYTPRQK